MHILISMWLKSIWKYHEIWHAVQTPASNSTQNHQKHSHFNLKPDVSCPSLKFSAAIKGLMIITSSVRPASGWFIPKKKYVGVIIQSSISTSGCDSEGLTVGVKWIKETSWRMLVKFPLRDKYLWFRLSFSEGAPRRDLLFVITLTWLSKKRVFDLYRRTQRKLCLLKKQTLNHPLKCRSRLRPLNDLWHRSLERGPLNPSFLLDLFSSGLCSHLLFVLSGNILHADCVTCTFPWMLMCFSALGACCDEKQ